MSHQWEYIIFSKELEQKGPLKLYETLPIIGNRTNDWRLNVRKERAKKVDLMRKPAAPLATISLRPERISTVRDLLSEKHGNIPKGELADYVAIGKKVGSSELLLTFRSPDQMAYSEAQVMRLRNRSLWQSSAAKVRQSEDVPLYLNKETQTVQVNDQDSPGSDTGNKKHSQLYFYRYLTSQSYEDVERCTYLRHRAGVKKEGGRAVKREGSPAHYSQKMFIFKPPALKPSKQGALRRQQSKNLHSVLNN